MPHSKILGAIFIAIPKTGSTSLVSALIKMQGKGVGKPDLLKEKITPEFRKLHRLDEIGDSKPGRAKHLSAIQLKYILGDEEFERCFKFSIVRNPWSRTVTRYFYTHANNEPDEETKQRRGTSRTFHEKSFEEWVEARWQRFKNKDENNSQIRKLVDLDGNMLVDYVGRLETIQDSLDHICNSLGVEPMQMPHVNSSGKRPHYSTYYNKETIEMVREISKDDIEYFDFKFENQKE